MGKASRMRVAPIPCDHVVEIAAGPGQYLYGVDRWRATICRLGRSWEWKVWDVIDPSLGGDGLIEEGRESTKDKAMGCLDILRGLAGITHDVSGDA